MTDDGSIAPTALTGPPLPLPPPDNVASPPSVTGDATSLLEGDAAGEQQSTADEPSFVSPVARAARKDDGVGDYGQPASGGSNTSSRTPATTSRKKKKRAGGGRMAIKKRCKVTRQMLFHALTTDTQRECVPKEAGNRTHFYGTVKAGNSSMGWRIDFDILPEDEKRALIVGRNVKVVQDNEEEKPWDADEFEDDEPSEKRPKKMTPEQKALDDFLNLSDEDVCKLETIEIPWGRDGCANQKIVWKVHGETDHITESPWQVPDSPGPDLSHVDFDAPIIDNFFEHVFPDVKGHAKIIDKFLSDPRAKHHKTHNQLGHKFHDETAEDPDWLVKQCYTLLIAGATQLKNGIENLWKRGQSDGLSQCPDFGQHVEQKLFKCWKSAAAFAWADRKCWCCDK